MSRFDQYYRRVSLGLIYRDGWGSVNDLAKIIYYRRNIVGNRDICKQYVPEDYPINIEKESKYKHYSIIEGSLITPLNELCGDIILPVVKTAKFQLLLPNVWKTQHRPIVFHYAGTGDQNYWRRRLLLAKPLLMEHNIASLILENPYYGDRKPDNQTRSNLNYVQDLFVLGGCIITESLALMNWCERLGFGPFLLTGLSMGGFMACLAATVWSKPLAVVPCLSWTTAAPTFTRGVMANAIPWQLLEKQYFENTGYNQIRMDVKALSALENLKRRHKQVCAFLPDSQVNFNDLRNYNITEKNKPIHPEVLEFMHIIMDECTHLLNYDTPVDTEMVKVISAKDDCYILHDGVNDMQSVWPGCQVEYIDKGHVTAFVSSQNLFRKNIVSMLDKLIKKHYS